MLNKLKNIFANKQTVDASQPNTETISVDITEPVIEATLPAPSKEKKPRKQKTSDTTKSSGKMSRKQKTSGTTKSSEKKLSPKEIATNNREPYVTILSVELDPSNIGNGAFELDWNEFFIAKLIRAGYKGADDAQIVDQWFQDVCRNVVLETFEQFEANNPRPLSGVQRKDLGAGRTEVS